MLPLVELANRPEVNHVSGLADTIDNLPVATLAEAYLATVRQAPRRSKRDKRYLVGHHGTVPGASNRVEDHLAVALINDQVDLTVGAEEAVALLDYQVPLKARLGDRGVGKIDLLGYGTSGRLFVIELKTLTGRGRGETPLRALLEGLAYCALLEGDWLAVIGEVEATGRPVVGARPSLVVAATAPYWSGWQTSRASGEWTTALGKLITDITQNLGVNVTLIDIGDLAPLLVGQRPRISGTPHCALVI